MLAVSYDGVAGARVIVDKCDGAQVYAATTDGNSCGGFIDGVCSIGAGINRGAIPANVREAAS